MTLQVSPTTSVLEKSCDRMDIHFNAPKELAMEIRKKAESSSLGIRITKRQCCLKRELFIITRMPRIRPISITLKRCTRKVAPSGTAMRGR